MYGIGATPDATKADIPADAPGIVEQGIPNLLASSTILKPGSDITGRPASEIIATFKPSLSLLITSSVFVSWLKLW